MTFERELITMKETLTFKCILPLDKLMITLLCVFVMMKNKQNLYFSDYYKTITHVQKHKIYHLKLFSYTYK